MVLCGISLKSTQMAAEVISKKQKIRFLLGIFDGNDNQLFNKAKFMKMMKALYHGTAAMFRSSTPSKWEVTTPKRDPQRVLRCVRDPVFMAI